MTDAQRRSAAKAFSAFWQGKGYEKGESQPFWLSLLSGVLGVKNPEQFIAFEDKVMMDHTGFIDGSIRQTHVLIEQKGLDRDLRKPIRQSDGTLLTPFQQAKRYAAELPYSQRPRWIVTCNFKSFLIYDMETPSGEPEEILLANLEKEYYRLNFLVDTGDDNIKKEMEISIQAGRLVGVLYEEILKQYRDPGNEHSLKSLNKLCVRLVFCLYAEDAGIFGQHLMFHHYIRRFQPGDLRRALIALFRVLNQRPVERDPYLEAPLNEFPYVNGDLFEDDDLEIPQLNQRIADLLLHNASEDFDWSDISPTIFGAVFESTLNPETRRSGGMHYTSIENIHKVIDPLFLDGLKQELSDIKAVSVLRARVQKLEGFQAKLAGLAFLDPACGSGNFLTETYLCLRQLENEVVRALIDARKGDTATAGQIMFGEGSLNPIQVSIGQFFGIEINDFAVAVAKTALWIAESQMLKKTEDIVHLPIDFLPLKSYTNIHEANALRIDWETVVPKDKLNYIMGNPPFAGYSLQSKDQKRDILSVYVDGSGKSYKAAGKIDYVAGWYFKASQFMQDTLVCSAFVSTNSITQGEQVSSIWEPLYNRFHIHIDFAHKTFLWDSEASLKAHVHVVIIGFSIASNKKKILYSNERIQEVNNINAYLVDAPDILVESRSKSINDVPEMIYGNKPTDGGFLFLTPDEYLQTIQTEPDIAKFIRRVYGATEYINNKPRYCLWLNGASPIELRKSKLIMERVNAVKEFRMSSPKEATRKSANSPTLFQEIRHPKTEYIIVPRHSSESRRYIPFGFVSPEIIVNDAVQIIPYATSYHYGVLSSNVHMAWVRAVCGRIKSDYRYSKDIVYNNFPWPSPTPEQKAKIEQTAQAILDARLLYPDSSLADLYDEVTMPPELRKAHQNNDRAVMQAYGFSVKMTESECVAELMKLYQKLVEKA